MPDMRNAIAGAMAGLGVLLVLAGAAIVFVKAFKKVAVAAGLESEITYREGSQPTLPDGVKAPKGPGVIRRILGAIGGSDSADRLIIWGVILLVLGAFFSGAVEFTITNKVR
jgi:hypothetical protein